MLPSTLKTILGGLSTRHRAGISGIGWSGLGQAVGLVIKLGSTLILTRLLAPEVYGILGTAMAVLTTLEWLSDLGIQPALIRHEKGDRPEYLNTGWMMGVGRGIILSTCAAAAAWPLSEFYGEATLLGVLWVLALRPLLFALRSPAFPLLKRNLNYKFLFIDEVAQTVIGTLCSIAMAFALRSVWAIVLGTMAGACISVVLSYVLCPMMPRLKWDRQAANDVYKFGQQVFVNTLVMAAWLNLDRLLGLRLLEPAQMGLYAIAFNLSAVLESLITRICDVYFSLLVREEDPKTQRAWHDKIIGRVAAWGMPAAGLILMASPWVVWVLYDPRYSGAGIIFAVLMGRLMIRTIGQLQFQYLMALAEVRLATYAYLVAVILQVIMLVPLVNWLGPIGMALSVLISTTAVTLTQTALLDRHAGNAWKPFLSTTAWAFTGMALLVSVYGTRTLSHDAETSPTTTIIVSDEG